MHEVLSPWLLGVGWVLLLTAHYWNRSRHQGGGLPWVLGVLWLSTWVMVTNTVIFVTEEGFVGHEAQIWGVNWPHLVQTATAVAFLALLALEVTRPLRLHRVDLARFSGGLLRAHGWRIYAVGQLANLATAITLGAAVALIVGNLG